MYGPQGDEILNDVVGQCDRKVEKGKLLRISVVLRSKDGSAVLRNVGVFGDFFMHPEEAIEGLEEAILRSGLDVNARETAISSFLSESGTELFGASAKDLAQAVQGAIDDALSKNKEG